MAQKRVLPLRANRGRRPPPSQQQKVHDDALYEQFFERTQIENTQTQKKKQKQISQDLKAHIQAQQYHKQIFALNRVVFPYSRGFHYFFDLASFPRLDNSVSYAIDQENVFANTYIQENKQLNSQLKLKDVLNRNFFGLPYVDREHTAPNKSRDKNICHGYLFQNQDRKFNLDKSIYELKQILKNFQKIIQDNTIVRFSCLKKDSDFLVLFQNKLQQNEKKELIQKKIKMLLERKQNLRNYMLSEDKIFYYHSLNQQLHNLIQQRGELLTYQYMINQIEFVDHLRNTLKLKNECDRSQGLKQIFKFYLTENVCMSNQILSQLNKKINDKFFQKEENSQFYQITVPFMFLNFSDQNLMSACQKLLAIKLIYQSQALFYVAKIFWKRIFNRQLLINKQVKPISKIEYEKQIFTIAGQLQKWKRQNKLDESQQIVPNVQKLINWQCFQQDKKCFDLLSLKNGIQIMARQYICLVLFYHLYLCIQEIHQFMQNNSLLFQLIANQNFSKYNHLIVEALRSQKIGVLDQILRKITEWFMRSDFQIDFKIKWSYNEVQKIAYIAKLSKQPQWETEKQQSNQQFAQCQPNKL